MWRAAAPAGALAHGVALWFAVSDTDGFGVALGVAAILI